LGEIENNPPLERKGGAYEISHLDIVRISGYYDLKLDCSDLDFQNIESESDLDSD
jgi:hypothetical protein